jgi:hypothetical protein
MDQLEHIVGVISVTMGTAWASGINLYAAIAVLGLLGTTTHMDLPAGLQILTNPLVISAAGIMYAIEFFTDKIQGIDTVWDGLHTFIRIPAGALLAAGAAGSASPPLTLAAALIGGGVAAATHAAKTGTRIMVNASPEPASNWAVSLGEDISVVAGLWTAFHHPLFFVILLCLFLIFISWLLPRIWLNVKKGIAWPGRFLRQFQDRATYPVNSGAHRD